MEVTPTDRDDTRGMSLRELVLEVRDDMKAVRAKVDTHLLEHAIVRGQQRGEARILGFGRSGIALIVSLVSATATIWSALH